MDGLSIATACFAFIEIADKTFSHIRFCARLQRCKEWFGCPQSRATFSKTNSKFAQGSRYRWEWKWFDKQHEMGYQRYYPKFSRYCFDFGKWVAWTTGETSSSSLGNKGETKGRYVSSDPGNKPTSAQSGRWNYYSVRGSSLVVAVTTLTLQQSYG